jgi:hypothetical protein
MVNVSDRGQAMFRKETMRARGYAAKAADLTVLSVGFALFGVPFALVLFSPLLMAL